MRNASLAQIVHRVAETERRSTQDALPIARPLLPSADRLGPYLREIDANRTYSNFGPLVRRLEERLAERLELETGRVVTVTNATLGIAAALAAQGARQGAYCLLPGWTFVATAHAAIQAGLVPYFVDVDPLSWALEPDAAKLLIERLSPSSVGAVVPVAPFGRPVDVEAWDRFAEETGVAVVIDAAAGFDALRASRVPAVVSLHATKALGAGEGGFLATTDPGFAVAFQQRINFGFFGDRSAAIAATNAKMSEYNAAVALAALDGWAATRARLAAAAEIYRGALDSVPGVQPMAGCGREFVATTFVAELPADAPPLDRIETALAAQGVSTRRWWNRGLHREPAFVDFPATDLSVTERLAERTIGLPFWIDMKESEAVRVADALAEVLGHPPRSRRPTATPPAENAPPPTTSVGREDGLLLRFCAARIALRARGRSALEFGIGSGVQFEAYRARFDDYTGLDPSPALVEETGRRWGAPGMRFVEGSFAGYRPQRRFDNVIMSFVLDRVDDPAALLRRALDFLVPGGRLFAAVSNAKGLDRRLDHHAGLVPDYFALGDEKKDAGLRRRFDAARLRALAAECGCRVQRLEGLFLKPVASSQLAGLGLRDSVLNAMLEVGIDYPELCAGMLAEIVPATA
jgi:dTDP-4-amino-4,6-dideoxygalactose transaminase/SAM-dependent methyltransferase